MGRAQPCMWKNEGRILESWRLTTLDQLDKKEEFLEEIIFREPRLLDLESLETGIRGPYLGFRQIAFQTPQGRPIRPDIVFLTAGGHVVVVEVKRGSNPELRDRQVIAQVVDYAGSFAQFSEDQLFRLFQPGAKTGREATSWPEWIAVQFPDTDDPDELADVLLSRFRDGELHLCIVCDKAPPGIRELVEGVASQSALGFDLSLIEVHPHVREGRHDEILFMPTTPLRTEIISRTAVRFLHEPGTERPIVQIMVDSPQAIEEAIQTHSRNTMRPRFREVLDHYEGISQQGFEIKANERSSVYRLIFPSHWPWEIHYEFCDYRANIGVEIHLEGENVRPLSPVIEPLAEQLMDAFPEAIEVKWYPRALKGRGALRITYGPDCSPKAIAIGMKTLVERTSAIVDKAVKDLNVANK